MHTVCAVMTEQFLSYSKAQGNDLSSPRLGFPGLKEGDHWCLCAPRWKEAFDDGMAPLINLEATEQSTLKIIQIEILRLDLKSLSMKVKRRCYLRMAN